MRAIWKGTISFGLISIPVSLYPAVRREELKFHLLRKSDLSPIDYKRVAEADGKEVSWDQIVKGYEYANGKYVVLDEKDFKRVDVEATQTVEIVNFVKLEEVNPILFNKPYYMEVGRGGDNAYALLREALQESEKIAIAKVVIKTRQYLASVKPQGQGLMLELMYFPQEIRDVTKFKQPAKKKLKKRELAMAGQLIASMSSKWDPEEYTDDYHVALEKMIKKKIQQGGKTPPEPKEKRQKRPSNVIDLVSVLQESLREAGRPSKRTRQSKVTRRRKAA